MFNHPVLTTSLGKQARVGNNDEGQRKNDHSAASSQPPAVTTKNMPASEPGYGVPAMPQPAAVPDAYSVAPGDGAINRAARADGVAANHVEDKQNLQGSGNKARRIDDVTKLVAEENASRSKFPRYAGLERWELLEKMGDGAFSNVYRARDLEGDAGEVAIKVVRKFEMNSMQVSIHKSPTISLPSHNSPNSDRLFPLYSKLWRLV